jgi:hypothetical protein
MSMRKLVALVEAKNDLVEAKNNVGLSAKSWSIYQPEDEDDTESEYLGYRIVADALNASASKAAAEVNKKVAALMQNSNLDESGLVGAIIDLIIDVRTKFLEPVADKYAKYGVYDQEVTSQWDYLVIDHALLAVPFAFRQSLRDKIKRRW